MEGQGMRGVVRDLRTLFVSGSIGGLTDVQLLERFIGRRDEGAFEALMSRHGPLVWGVCRRLLRNHQDAEDAFQATFLILARKAPSVRPREMLPNWLYGVAYRTASKARRTRTRRDVRERTVNELPELFKGSRAFQDDLTERLDRELTRLPEKYRIPIILCDLEEKSHKDAAVLLGWPIGTVSGRLSRGRTLLAKRLTKNELSPSGSVLTVLLSQNVGFTSLPSRLIESTAKAATVAVLSQGAVLGIVSTQVVILTEGVLRSMIVTKIKIATAAALSGFALFAGGTGIGLMAQTDNGPAKAGDSAKARPASKPSADASPPAIASDAEDAPRVDSPPPKIASDADVAPRADAPPPATASDAEDAPRADGLPLKIASDAAAAPSTNSGPPELRDSPFEKPAARPSADQPPPASFSGTSTKRPSSPATPRTSHEEGGFNTAPPLTDSPASAVAQPFGNSRKTEKPPARVLSDPLFGGDNDDVEEVELAIARGVLDAEQFARGKSAREIQRMIEQQTRKLKEEHLKIRTLEAGLRRLSRIRDNQNGGKPPILPDQDSSIGSYSDNGGLGP